MRLRSSSEGYYTKSRMADTICNHMTNDCAQASGNSDTQTCEYKPVIKQKKLFFTSVVNHKLRVKSEFPKTMYAN